MEKLFEGEYKLMEVLWDAGAVNSTHLVELCREELGWNKSTTYTVLRRLKQRITLLAGILTCLATVSLFLSRVWLIPKDAKKPADGRKKEIRGQTR